ncbi:MAG TPA: hypothetical protein VGK31_04405 [Thermoanaerobaculia bacterium]
MRFGQALLTFDPVQQQPEPPGYPLHVALGRLFNFFVHDPFFALLALSIVASVAGVIIVSLLATELLGDLWSGAAAALVLYLSPAMLVFGPLPNAEATAMALIAGAMLAFVRGDAIWFAIFAAAAIGARPEIALAILAMVCVALAISPGMRRASAAVIGGATLLLCFIPLIEAIRGRFGDYVITNYAALRTASAAVGLHGRELVLRFIAHPWGSKWLSFPILIAAVVGLGMMKKRALPLAAFAISHLLFCFAVADRGDGVQPVIPSMIAVAIFAAAALSRWPRAAFAAALVYGAAAFLYAWPILYDRHRMPSPAAAAMRYARRYLPADAVLMYEPPLEAWARFSRIDVAPIRDFDRYADQKTPLFLLADGGSSTPHARTFFWRDSDAYGKVTTNRYRVVTLIPFPPAARYRSLGGVYQFERSGDEEWRWLGSDALIALPPLGPRVVHLVLALPADAPIDRNTVSINGVPVTVTRGRPLSFSFPARSPLRIHSARSFTSPRDRRTLAVQLLSLEQR